MKAKLTVPKSTVTSTFEHEHIAVVWAEAVAASAVRAAIEAVFILQAVRPSPPNYRNLRLR
jgi:hypothetical protein